jgi:maltose-binding protein MalE
MISKYYGITRTQDYIYNMMGPTYDTGGYVFDTNQLNYYIPSNGLNKPHSIRVTSGLTFSTAVSEINNNRPFVSLTTAHSRACRGYSDTGFGLQYLAINDPWPIGSGLQTVEVIGSEARRIYVRS